MWETPAPPASSKGRGEGWDSFTVPRFARSCHFHGLVLAAELWRMNYAVRKTLDRLHAYWNRPDVVRSPGNTGKNGQALQSLPLGSSWSCQNELRGVLQADVYIDRLRASTVVGPAARLPTRQAVHHAGFDAPHTGRRFQAVSRNARTSHGPKSQKTSCSHASRQAASWGTGPLTRRSRSAFQDGTEASPGGVVRAGTQADAARRAADSLSLPIPAPRGQPAFS